MKKIAMGCDHGGFELKEILRQRLQDEGYEVQDFGCYTPDPVEYPEIAFKVAGEVAARPQEYEFGILCCGTGIGVSIVANKVKGVRAALCADCFSARMAKEHNNANIIVFPARFISNDEAVAMLDAYFSAQFEGGRHEHRIEKMAIPCCTAGETAK